MIMWHSISHLSFVEHYEHHAVIESTSTYAVSHPFTPQKGLALFVADVQTAGRGQRTNTFFSASAHGLWATIMVRVDDIADHFSVNRSLSCAIAVALAARVPGSRIAIKWPNDVYLNDRKICGILLQSVNGQPRTIAAGFGINVNLAQSEFPSDLVSIATSLLIETGGMHDREQLLFDILNGFMANRVRSLVDIHGEYSSMLFRRNARVMLDGREGIFEGVLPDGRLCLRIGNQREYIVSGIIKYL